MQQDRHHLLAGIVANDRLNGAHLAQHDRIDRFEVGRVGHEGQVHLVAIELAIGAGAEVIFHIARTAHIVRIR